MDSEHPDDGGVRTALESHELEIKRTIETFGKVEDAFAGATRELHDVEALRELERIGKALEAHEQQLERQVETLDDLKGTVRQVDGRPESGLDDEMEKARRRARQEDQLPSPDHRDR